MTKETKVTLITGFTFIAIFFSLMIAEVLLHEQQRMHYLHHYLCIYF